MARGTSIILQISHVPSPHRLSGDTSLTVALLYFTSVADTVTRHLSRLRWASTLTQYASLTLQYTSLSTLHSHCSTLHPVHFTQSMLQRRTCP